MSEHECPVCGEEKEWHYVAGECEREADGSGQQLEPDEWWCDRCGFRYSQHINHSMDEAAKAYRTSTTNILAKIRRHIELC